MVASLQESGPQPGIIVAGGAEYPINRNFFNRQFLRAAKAKIQQAHRDYALQIGNLYRGDESEMAVEIKTQAVRAAINPMIGFEDIPNIIQDPDMLAFVISKACGIEIEIAEQVADECNLVHAVMDIANCMGLDALKNSAPQSHLGTQDQETQ